MDRETEKCFEKLISIIEDMSDTDKAQTNILRSLSKGLKALGSRVKKLEKKIKEGNRNG